MVLRRRHRPITDRSELADTALATDVALATDATLATEATPATDAAGATDEEPLQAAAMDMPAIASEAGPAH